MTSSASGDTGQNERCDNTNTNTTTAIQRQYHNYVTSPTAFIMKNIRRIVSWITSRMGSFSSAPRIPNEDKADSDLSNLQSSTWEEMLKKCRSELENWPPLIKRNFVKYPMIHGQISGKYDVDNSVKDPSTIRILQWNVLSEALGKVCGNDNFVACPEGALEWKLRRWRLLEEIVSVKPDILCLQEVDHFKFLESTLGALGFKGVFCPKPDSPCVYVVGNNGPDGCAIFWNEKQWELVRSHERTLEVWGCTSNQVSILTILKRKNDNLEGTNSITNRTLAVATTHLKARQGTLLSTLRHEQGKDLLNWIRCNCPTDCPLVLSGDFNGEPCEPVYSAVLNDPILNLDSSYASTEGVKSIDPLQISNNKSIRKSEPPYTTWKIRGEGEDCHTIDYTFYTKNSLVPERVLAFPTGDEIGPARVPSYQYPSDHFSLVTDFRYESNCT